MYRLMLFDLDGTLLRSDKTVSRRTAAAIDKCRERGYLIGIATSRSECNTCGCIEKLKPNVIISSDGASVKIDGKCVFKAEFTLAETRYILQNIWYVCGESCGITADTIGAHYRNFAIGQTELDESQDNGVYTDFKSFNKPTLKMCAEIFDKDKAEHLKASLPECDCVRFFDCYWYKFTKSGITKEKAIRELCSSGVVRADEIISFGDDYVDIGMLNVSGLGIAMGNAVPEVKEVANIVIGSNDEDGIAQWLEMFTRTEQ